MATPRRLELLSAARQAVKRVVETETLDTLGTAVRVSQQGIFVTASHVISADGKLLECKIDGQDLNLIRSFHTMMLPFCKASV